MPKHCEITPEMLSAFVDGELPADERHRLAQHIAACPQCSRQIGVIYSLKVCLDYPEQQAANVPAGFWPAVRRRLDEVDALAKKIVHIGPRPTLTWRLGVLLAAGVLLVACALSLRGIFTPQAMSWTHLAEAHKAAAARLPATVVSAMGRFGGGEAAFSEVTARPTHTQVIHTQMCRGWQMVYCTRGAVVSHFLMPCNNLDTSELMQVRDADRLFYLDTTPQLAMIAWRKGTGWDVLVGDLYIEQLFALAKLYAQSAQLTGLRK